MVTDGMVNATGLTTARAQATTGDLTIWINGEQPLSAELVAALGADCDRAEERAGQARVVLQVYGAPAAGWPSDLPIAVLSRWERWLRRLERMPVVTIALAAGDCGGPALDALLATDYRIATPATRLVLPTVTGATWPGMALHRLTQQAGAAAVRRTVLFGVPIEAREALRLGLVDALADDLVLALAGAAELTRGFSGTEVAIRRQLTLDALTTSFDEALSVHLAACDRALRRAASRPDR